MLIHEFAIGPADTVLLIGLHLAPGIVFVYPGGAIGRRFGDRRVVGVGMVMMVAGGLLMKSSSRFSIWASWAYIWWPGSYPSGPVRPTRPFFWAPPSSLPVFRSKGRLVNASTALVGSWRMMILDRA